MVMSCGFTVGPYVWAYSFLVFSTLQSVKNFTKCSIRNEQICSKLANCKSCSLNLNCQWDHQQHECHALPGKVPRKLSDFCTNVFQCTLIIKRIVPHRRKSRKTKGAINDDKFRLIWAIFIEQHILK